MSLNGTRANVLLHRKAVGNDNRVYTFEFIYLPCNQALRLACDGQAFLFRAFSVPVYEPMFLNCLDYSFADTEMFRNCAKKN